MADRFATRSEECFQVADHSSFLNSPNFMAGCFVCYAIGISLKLLLMRYRKKVGLSTITRTDYTEPPTSASGRCRFHTMEPNDLSSDL
jgi:hypothetical protein